MSKQIRKHSIGAHVLPHRTQVSMSAFPCPHLNIILAVSYDNSKIIYCSTTCVKIFIASTKNINPFHATIFSRKVFCFIFQRYTFNLWDAGKQWLKVSSRFHSRDMCDMPGKSVKGTIFRHRHIPSTAREVLTFSSLSAAKCASSHLGFVAGDVTPKVRMKVQLSQPIIKRQAIQTHSGVHTQLCAFIT
jgi:hypothetical protein